MLLLKIIGVYVFIYWPQVWLSLRTPLQIPKVTRIASFSLSLTHSPSMPFQLASFVRDAIRYQDCRESIVYIKKLIVHSDSMCVNRTLSTYVIFFILIVSFLSFFYLLLLSRAANARAPFTFIGLHWNAVAFGSGMKWKKRQQTNKTNERMNIIEINLHGIVLYLTRIYFVASTRKGPRRLNNATTIIIGWIVALQSMHQHTIALRTT